MNLYELPEWDDKHTPRQLLEVRNPDGCDCIDCGFKQLWDRLKFLECL